MPFPVIAKENFDKPGVFRYCSLEKQRLALPERGRVYASPEKETTAMKLLVFVLNNEEHLDKVLEAYIEAGVTGATLLDSEGMGRFLTYEVPLFAGFKEFMKGNKPYNKTIISVIRDNSVAREVRKLVDEIVGGLDNPGTGIMFTLPVEWASGLVEEEEGE